MHVYVYWHVFYRLELRPFLIGMFSKIFNIFDPNILVLLYSATSLQLMPVNWSIDYSQNIVEMLHNHKIPLTVRIASHYIFRKLIHKA